MIIALTGATGFIGRRLIPRLQKEGYTVRALGRKDPEIEGVEFTPWNAIKEEPPATALRDAGVVIHLAGEPVGQRWTTEVKRMIEMSRVVGTRNLVSAIGKLSTKPGALISMSAVGFYGDRKDDVLVESAAPGNDFLARVCAEWEREARQAGAHELRVAILRSGIVLGPDGGVLKQMLPPFKSGVGGTVGSGKQWVSWIHLDDLVEMIAFAVRYDRTFGTWNATSPEPVRNADFAKALGAALGKPAVVPVPAFALKIMYGEMASMLLESQRAMPEAATRAGFAHKFPILKDALEDVLSAT